MKKDCKNSKYRKITYYFCNVKDLEAVEKVKEEVKTIECYECRQNDKSWDCCLNYKCRNDYCMWFN
jgi:hypothetical protein